MDLKGKTINFLGDSITYGYGTTGPAFRYDTLLAKACGLRAANNYSVGALALHISKNQRQKTPSVTCIFVPEQH